MNVELIQMHTLSGSIICTRHHVLGSTIRVFEKALPQHDFIQYKGAALNPALRMRAFEYGKTTAGPQGRPVFHYFEIDVEGNTRGP